MAITASDLIGTRTERQAYEDSKVAKIAREIIVAPRSRQSTTPLADRIGGRA